MRRDADAAGGGGVRAGAGRICPRDYGYPATVFRRPPDLTTAVLYVVGGLYGNLAALDVIERMAAAEAEPPVLVFNGDFHWFDADPDWFAAIEQRVSPHPALRGNVETEVARSGDIGAGCGCAYPASVDDGVVRRSNEILMHLRRVARTLPGVQARLGSLPMHLTAQVGPLRIGIVHGDGTSLAGWGFAQDALDSAETPTRLAALRRDSDVDLFASTHTCLAALRDVATAHGRLTVINNGAAGMPNFAGDRRGLISRIAVSPSPHPTLYGCERNGVHIDAVPVAYDAEAFLERFRMRWPEGSPAHDSYHQRIIAGPAYRRETACGV